MNSDPNQPARLILLCQNREGYARLARLVSRTYVEGRRVKGAPMLDPAWLEDGLPDLIALSGGLSGRHRPGTDRRLGRMRHGGAWRSWLRVFPDRYYLEVHRTGREHEPEYLARATGSRSRIRRAGGGHQSGPLPPRR